MTAVAPKSLPATRTAELCAHLPEVADAFLKLRQQVKSLKKGSLSKSERRLVREYLRLIADDVRAN